MSEKTSIYPRTEYEMTQADLDSILDACKSVPYMIVGGRAPSSPQENANNAWKELGSRMGFDHMTVQPSKGGGRFFSAVPSETEDQRIARVEKQEAESKAKKIESLKAEIQSRQEELNQLSNEHP